MCGIAGQVGRDPRAIQGNYGAYCAMQRTLARRGPDQRGMYISGRAALIHARLAVVDLENGCQPMQLDWQGESYTLVYNGELYNTDELRAALQNRGHHFAGHSDTEVVLHAYAEWGTNCIERFNGIFAFAVWAVRAGTLFLARDRCGVKPLFYAQTKDSLIFGSEIKTLLAHPAVPPRVDAEGLAQVLLLGPGRVPGSGVFQNVRELLPGQCAWYEADTGRLTSRRYWQLVDHEHPDDFAATARKVRELLLDAIQRQLVSDVPVATFLSGGLDSSLISAVADANFTARGKTLHTFSVGYKDTKRYFRETKFQPGADAPFIRRMNEVLHAQELRAQGVRQAMQLARERRGEVPPDDRLVRHGGQFARGDLGRIGDLEVAVEERLRLRLRALVVEKEMQGVKILIVRIDAVTGKTAAQAVGAVVHDGNGFDHALPVHARAAAVYDARDRAPGRVSEFSFSLQHRNFSVKAAHARRYGQVPRRILFAARDGDLG